MARVSDGGTGSRIIVSYPGSEQRGNVWSLQSYPYPDPDFNFPEDMELAYSEERLYWRESRTLAYGAGKMHPVEEEHLLIGWDELMKPPDTLPKPKGRV